jgi:hypothetical protein
MNNPARQPLDARAGLTPEEQVIFDETAVLLAAALPPRRVSVLHLQIIHARIQDQTRRRSLRRRTLLAVTGWAAAAALVILHFTQRPAHSRLPPETIMANQRPGPQPGPNSMAQPGTPGSGDPVPAASTSAPGGEGNPLAPLVRKLTFPDADRLVQLEQRLRHLEITEDGATSTAPGTSDLMLLELKDPTPAGTATTQGDVGLRLLALLARQFGQASAGSSAEPGSGFEAEPVPAVVAPASEALATFDPVSGTGLLFLENLPAPAPDEAYQIWITTGEGTAPVNAGLLPDFGGASTAAAIMTAPGMEPSSILITREPAGGSAAPGANIVKSWPER